MPAFDTEHPGRRPKYPTLPYRPASYVCVLCSAVEPSKRAARVEQAARARKTRQKSSGDATEAP